MTRVGREVFAQVERLPKLTIAAVNGHVIGDGLALALACDLRIASVAATFRLPEVACGFIPGWGLIHRLVASAGRTNAAELLLTGQPVEAARARAMGFVNEVVSSETLIDEVMKRARKRWPISVQPLLKRRNAPFSEAMRGDVLRPSGTRKIGGRESTLYSQRGPRCTEPTGKDVRTAISLDEFKRTDLRMGEFLAAEPVPITGRLLKLTVDLGEERPPVVTGLARGYAPKGLHGHSVFPRSCEDSGGSLNRR